METEVVSTTPVVPVPTVPVKPPPPPLAESLSALQSLREEHMDIMSRIQGMLEENAPTSTYGDLFTNDDGDLEVGGELFPAIEGLADLTIDPEKYKGPMSKVRISARQLATTATRLQKAIEQYEDRIQRQITTAARKAVGARDLRRFRGAKAVALLDPFDNEPGRSEGVLSFTNGGTYIALNTRPPTVELDKSDDLKTRSSSNAVTSVMHESALLYYNNLLDHSPAIRLATNLKKVVRNIELRMALVNGGHVHSMRVVVVDGSFKFEGIESSPAGTHLKEGLLTITPSLSYQIRFNSSDLDHIIDSIGDLDTLPLYRVEPSSVSDPFAMDGDEDEDEDDDLDLTYPDPLSDDDDAAEESGEMPELTAAAEDQPSSNAGEPAADPDPTPVIEEPAAPVVTVNW